jgi:hypothetical protein
MPDQVAPDFTLVEAVANHPYVKLRLTDEVARFVSARLKSTEFRQTVAETIEADHFRDLILNIANRAIRQWSVEEPSDVDCTGRHQACPAAQL